MEKKKTVVKTYRGKHENALQSFKRDAEKMAADGYHPTSQNWAPGSYGCGAFLIALLLCLILVGILVFIYMVLVKPDGTLTVTYELKESITEQSDDSLGRKACPRCAELIMLDAVVCRFCSHEFKE